MFDHQVEKTKADAPGILSRPVLDGLFALVAVVSTDGTVLETNEAPLTVAGVTADDVIGQAAWDCVWWTHDVTAQQTLRDDIAAAAGGVTVRKDVEITVAGGGLLWIDFQLAPVRDDDGEVIYLVASGTEIGDRKAAEAALAANESRLRSIYASIDEGFCLCEMILDDAGAPVDYRFVEVNPLFESMTGLVDPVGRTALEMVPDLEQHWIDTYGRIAFGDVPLRFQQGSDAMKRWFDVLCLPIEPRGHLAILFKDITATRQAEASLHDAGRRDRYRELADALRDMLEPAEIVSFATNLLATTIGAPSVRYADVDQHRSADAGEADDADDTDGPAVRTALQTGRTHVVHGADTYPATDSWVVVPVVAGGSTVGRVVVHDDAPRHWSRLEVELVEKTAERVHAALTFARAHIELRASEERFRATAGGLPLPVWQIDADSKLEWANHAFYDFFGQQPDAFAGDGWRSLAHPGHTEFLAAFEHAVTHHTDFHGEVLAKHVSGARRWLESWAKPHFDADGRYCGHVGTNADITDRKLVEEAAQRSRERADLLTAMVTALEFGRPRPPASRAAARRPRPGVRRLRDHRGTRSHRAGGGRPPSRPRAAFHADRAAHRPSGTGRASRFHQPRAGGRHHILHTLDDKIIEHQAVDTVAGQLLGRLGPRSHMAVPLDLGDGARGALMVGISDPTRSTFTDGDLDFLAELASHASVIIASAVLQERERRISVRLQEALLPRQVAAPTGTTVAARYLAASDVLKVGGDWFDSIILDDGRVLLVVGDVVGHGLDAAAMMGRLRAGLAALTGQESEPGRLLEMLDRYARGAGNADYTTVCLAVLDPSTGALTHASAGHPPILVVEPGGTSRWLEGGRSMPLCVGEPATRPSASTTLERGATVVLYTDGLVERRGEHIDRGLERLEAVARRAHLEPATEICDRLITMATTTPTGDDTVVLCLRFTSSP